MPLSFFRSSSLPILIWGTCGGVLWVILSVLNLTSFIVPSQAFVVLSSYPAYTRQYEIGTTYSFIYDTSVLLNEPLKIPVSSPKDVGFKMDVEVDLMPLWQHPTNSQEQIMELKVTVPKLSVKARQGPTPTTFVSKPSRMDKVKTYPFFIHRENGLVKKVYFSQNEELSLVNLKKGIASLFQYQLKEGTVSETDTSGLCNVKYEEIDKGQWMKVKTNCQNTNLTPYFSKNLNKVLGANVENRATTSLEFDPDDSSLKTASALEVHILRPQMKKRSGAEVLSKQIMQSLGQSKNTGKFYRGSSAPDVITEISTDRKQKFIADELTTQSDPKECIYCKTLNDLVENFKSSLTPSTLGDQSSCIAFLRLLTKIRESEEDALKKVLIDKKYVKILPQLIEVVAAAQTKESHKVARDVLKWREPIELAERYLIGLSLSAHPPHFIIEDLLKVAKKGLKHPHLYATLILSLASMTNTFSRHNQNHPLTSDVEKLLINKLGSCSDDVCKTIYLRGLQNLRSRNSIEMLFKLAHSGSKKTSVAAIKAIQSLPDEYLGKKEFYKLEKLFFELDAPHDTSVRIVALDILLQRHPTEDLLRGVLAIMNNLKMKEFNTLILNHLINSAKSDENLNKVVKNVLTNSTLVNYHTFGQGGLSSAFSRPLGENPESKCYFTNMLEINSGLLKRSTVDVIVDVEDEKLNLLSFGIYAGGLGMFGSGDKKDTGNEDEEDANAGIEVSLLESQLRPFILFSGQGELMGHVWSGTASERTTALQGMAMLQDHNERIALQNGLTADLSLHGVVSYDFAGQVQVSLWNRNANSLVEVGAAMVLQGQVRVDNHFVQTMVEFNVGGETKLDLISDLDFSDEVSMCMKMNQNEYEVIHNVRKLERIPGSNYVLRKYKKRTYPMHGRTYVMNRKNTELCNKMFRQL